jgi:sterol 3beta-glucosyltransferase
MRVLVAAVGSRGDEDVIVIGETPHDRLLPQMTAVVHHAGAGTTAAGPRQ